MRAEASPAETEDRGEPISPSQFLFREVNEQIRQIADRWGRRWELDVLCECESGCFEHVRLEPAEYEAVRRHPSRFLVRPGHVADGAERVVETADGYLVVEKVGPTAALAIRLDPRRVRSDG
jgi:hypothetical protein